MEIAKLIADYTAGPQKLRVAIAGMTPEQIDAAPIAEKWSTRQVHRRETAGDGVGMIAAVAGATTEPTVGLHQFLG